MGNRCVITTKGRGDVAKSKRIGVYLHWNGGRNDVEAFLAYCKARGFRPPEQDDYGWARLCQVIGNFIGGDLSIGINTCDKLDCGSDNGTYIIENWEVVDRKYASWDEVVDEDYVSSMMRHIDECQPPDDRLWKPEMTLGQLFAGEQED